MFQADDLLFCYRWLLLEMKREFAFEDSLRMLEVLWSSLPAEPPEKELKLYDVLFHPPTISTPPISPLVKTPRENAYTKICALRRQSSSLSLSSYNNQKQAQIKRQNHSLDESISKCKNNVPLKMKHQSLDDTVLTSIKNNKTVDISPKSPKNPSNFSSRSSELLPVSPKSELRPRSVSPLEQKSDSVILNNRINFHHLQTRKSSSLSSSMANLMKSSKRSGHFKELKEKIITGKLFSSLDRLDTSLSIKEEEEKKPRGKIIKNFNEFLNFSNVNKNKIGDMSLEGNTEKPKILLTKSSFDDSESSACDHNSSSIDKPRRCSLTSNSCDDTFDETSPDDSQKYFPMTTSVTRELRLELENLDRKVFGDRYNERLIDSPSSDSELKTENDRTVTKELESNIKDIQEKRKNDDVFLWENPLHQTSPSNVPKTGSHYTHTPDEQAEIEYDTPSIVNEMSVTKSVTPIKIINQTDTIKNNSNSTISNPLKDIPETNNTYIPSSIPNDIASAMTNSCEEVTEAIKTSALLPPPNEFGGGNPFLMFLCITLLIQHRDHIMSKVMDYNEMAMHFDKMVRRHNVIRVLNQARQMYARYIKQHSMAQHKVDSKNEDC